MIAYLDKYNTTVDVPDNIGEKDLADINENFHSYVDQPASPQAVQPATPAISQPQAATAAAPSPQWQPNFYEGIMKPMLPMATMGIPTKPSPETEAFLGKAVEEGTFGLIKPPVDQQVQDHPAFAALGQIAGGVGSLLVAGGALRIAGLGTEAVMAGKAAVEAGFTAGERFIPRAIMTGATFGTRTFIAETVKAFEQGGVDLRQFGEHVLKDTAFGSIFGTIGGMSNAAASVSSAGALGFLSTKMEGGDNREASLNAAIWAAFETVGSVGRSRELRLEALGHLKESIGEYAQERNPEIQKKDAQRMAGQFVDNAVRKAGFDNAEDLAKSGPENLLEGIEKVNQAVRTAKIPMQETGAPVLPKLPAPIEPEASVAPKASTATPQTPIEKMVDYVKGLMGTKEPEVPQLPSGSRSYDEKISDLKAQGHDLAAIPPEKFPDDLRDISHYEQAKSEKAEITKSVSEISDRLSTLGIRPDEQKVIFDQYGLQKQGQFGQPSPLTDLVNTPIDDQYKSAYQALAEQRGIDKGDKFDSRTMEDARKSVDLINGYFNPQSQMVFDFAKQHPDASDHDVAQMASDRGLIDESNPDLLKLEIQKAKQEKIHAQIAPSAAAIPGVIPEVSARVRESVKEISDLVVPAKAAPLAAQITREQLGEMARSYDKAEASLSEAKALFNKQSKEDNLKFIDNLERGKQQENNKLTDISSTLRKLLDDKRKEVQALGKGKLEHFIENYFPHIWDQGDKQISQAAQKGAKRPLEGSKSFLKKRSIEFTSDGIAMGLTPISYNPVDIALLKLREMDKYVMAHRTIDAYKEAGLAQYVKVGGDVPEGWQRIDDRISTIFKSSMIPVKEAFDTQVMQGLNDVAKDLGINLERNFHAKEGRGQKADTWGLSFSQEAGQPGKIWTKFAGPESALAHELGHQIDNIYGLQEKFLSDPKIDKELTKLANERAPDNASEKFKAYIQTPPEKMAVMMEAYIHAPELLKETAPKTYAKLTAFLEGDDKLSPLTEVKPSLELGSNQGEVYAGGAVIAGHIYAQPDAARIINNYLSPGLQKSEIYQAYRYAGNLINQFQLGFSAFHLGFTTLDTAISKFALGLNELAEGHPIKSLANILATPFAPITNIIRGEALLKAWRGEGQSGMDNVIAQAMATAGGRSGMDQFYATKAFDQMKHYFQAGSVIRGILHIPLSIAEASSKPILEYVVPRQKLGVFADIMKMEMENHPDMTHSEMREIAQRAWDSVDNRMGQLVYDNIFWNRTFKDLLMATVRSTGWNLGTIRELGGGAKDYVEQASKAARGQKTELSYRMAYTAALPMLVGMLGAMTQYLRTGKGPQELKDYYFPKTGGVDAHGDPVRVTLPSYMKDLYHWKENPVKTATDKLQAILGIVADMLENKDYYGTKIRNEDDPFVKQVASEAEFMLKQIEPFAFRNMQKNLETGNKSLFDTVGPWVGFSPAPYDIDQTRAEKLAHDIAASHQEIGGRTEEQMERSRLLNDLARQYRRGDPKAVNNMYQAYQQGLISHRQMQEVVVNSRLTPLQRIVKGFTLQEIQRVYDKATDEEKGQIDSILRRKQLNQERNYAAR